MYSVMWSEHCSYKSSKKHLRQFGDKTTDAMKEHLLVGIGENAGVVDIGDGWAVTFKVESHNHPSYVEPYQGAATGVGGIVRDIISMGARPVAVMDQLRFGAVDHPDTARVVHGVVAGVGGYGNSLGLPNIGGELVFDAPTRATRWSTRCASACCGTRTSTWPTPRARATRWCCSVPARAATASAAPRSSRPRRSTTPSPPSGRPCRSATRSWRRCSSSAASSSTRPRVVEGIQDLGAAGISCATSRAGLQR